MKFFCYNCEKLICEIQSIREKGQIETEDRLDGLEIKNDEKKDLQRLGEITRQYNELGYKDEMKFIDYFNLVHIFDRRKDDETYFLVDTIICEDCLRGYKKDRM